MSLLGPSRWEERGESKEDGYWVVNRHRYSELSQNSKRYYLASLCPEASTHQVLPTQMPVYDKQTIQLSGFFTPTAHG